MVRVPAKPIGLKVEIIYREVFDYISGLLFYDVLLDRGFFFMVQ